MKISLILRVASIPPTIRDRNAASKFARYWNDRYKLFGSDKFCESMTLKGALKDDSLALSRGYVQLLPKPDTAGRAICYIDWSSHEPSVGYTEDSMVRLEITSQIFSLPLDILIDFQLSYPYFVMHIPYLII